MTRTAGMVLVVDHNDLTRRDLAAHLARAGYAVVTAEHDRRALQLLADVEIDIVLLTLAPAEAAGFELLGRIAADPQLRRIPLIAVCGNDEPGVAARSIELGAADYLLTPVELPLLQARLRAALAATSLRDAEAVYQHSLAQLGVAAASLQAGSFSAEALESISERDDAIGGLARAFLEMAHEVDARERRLKQQSQFKTALIGKITHELRSPFAAADFSIQLLRRYAERGMTDSMLEQVDLLDRQLAEGRRMIDGVISFAALVAKRAEPRPRPTDMARLIADTVTPLGRFARTRRVAIEVDVPPGLPLVVIDPEQVGEAVGHLLHNAVKFNQAGGRVRLSCTIGDGQLTVLVEDTGAGVAPEQLAAIWEAFEQTGDEVERGVEGLGIGLALVRSVVHAHHGEVVASSSHGAGSVFGFRIPLA